MTSKPIAFLFVDLGITKTHSRPPRIHRQPILRVGVQDHEEPLRLPKRFGSTEDARGYFQDFVHWYNEEHRHSGIKLLILRTFITGMPGNA